MRNCCFGSKHHEIITVGAGESFEYHAKLSLHHPGPFESELVIFLEDHGVREVQIPVRGTCVEAKDEN